MRCNDFEKDGNYLILLEFKTATVVSYNDEGVFWDSRLGSAPGAVTVIWINSGRGQNCNSDPSSIALEYDRVAWGVDNTQHLNWISQAGA